jgi:hypothetical protein
MSQSKQSSKGSGDQARRDKRAISDDPDANRSKRFEDDDGVYQSPALPTPFQYGSSNSYSEAQGAVSESLYPAGGVSYGLTGSPSTWPYDQLSGAGLRGSSTQEAVTLQSQYGIGIGSVGDYVNYTAPTSVGKGKSKEFNYGEDYGQQGDEEPNDTLQEAEIENESDRYFRMTSFSPTYSSSLAPAQQNQWPTGTGAATSLSSFPVDVEHFKASDMRLTAELIARRHLPFKEYETSKYKSGRVCNPWSPQCQANTKLSR